MDVKAGTGCPCTPPLDTKSGTEYWGGKMSQVVGDITKQIMSILSECLTLDGTFVKT